MKKPSFADVVPNNKPVYQGIHGKSIINHRIRVKLGLTCEQYCVMDLYEDLANKEDCITGTIDPWDLLGMETMELHTINDSLVKAGVLIIGITKDQYQKIMIAPKWRNEFKKAADTFDDLWKVFPKGTKAKALERYKTVVKTVPHDHLMTRRKAYCDWKKSTNTEWQYYLGLDVWLNPANAMWDNPLPTDVTESSGSDYKPGF